LIQLIRVGVVLALCQFAISWAIKTPTVVPASAPATEFSAERALKHVGQIAARPHPTGSAAHAATREYIVGVIRKLGLSPELQSTTGVGTRYAVAGHVQNILVRVPGSRPGGQAVLLVAHYDGVGAGPAAGDDATGSAALLEALRAIRAGSALTHDVIFLFTDSEEAGLLGAAAFVREHAWAKDVGVILNFEARGVSGPSLMFETGRGNRDVVSMLRRTGLGRGTSLSTAVYRRLPNDTDLSELMLLDRPAMNFAFIGDVGRYHTSEDDVAHLDPGSVQHHGAQALALARGFGNDSLPRPATADAVFFFFPGLGTIVYPEATALYIALFTLFLAIIATVRRRTVDPERWVISVTVGFGTALVALVVSACVGYALGGAFVSLHRAMATGESRWSETYAAAVGFSALALTLAAQRVAVRFASAVGVEAGALLLWSVVSVVVAVMMPGASFLFTWPVFFAVMALFVSPNESSVGSVMNWAATAVVVVIVTPTAYLMVMYALGLDAIGGTMVAGLVAMAATLARPVLVTSKDGWWPLVVAPAAALWAAIVGATTVRTNTAHPVGASLAMIIDADSARGYATGGWTGPVGSKFVSYAITGTQISGNYMGPAQPDWLRRMTGGRPVTLSERFVSSAKAPKVTVLKDSSGGDSRTVVVRIQPANNATLSMGLELDSSRVLAASVDGRAMDRSRYRRPSSRWRMDFIAPPDSGFTLSLTLEKGARPRLGVAARLEGLIAWPVTLPIRPPEVIGFQNGDISVVRTSVALEMPPRRGK
jgi:hypothetical protein